MFIVDSLRRPGGSSDSRFFCHRLFVIVSRGCLISECMAVLGSWMHRGDFLDVSQVLKFVSELVPRRGCRMVDSP